DVACRAALVSLPADPGLRARLASAQYNLGRFPDAAVLYRKLIDDYPAMLDYQTGYGWALQRMGKRKEAEAIFRAVLAVSPDNVNAQQGLTAP
ncbi:MAG TPA: tetratricopeptide repeat protein, partial [Polyangia bacterium]